MKDFISLLREQDEDTLSAKKALTAPIRNNRANKTCGFEEFIEMVQKAARNIMPECFFVPQEDVKELMHPDKLIDNPIIAYEVVSRVPLFEQKPTTRHEVIEKTDYSNEERIGTLNAWQFDYLVQFNLYASGYKKVQSVMNTFEEMILNYVGYFKKNGIIECLFKKQHKDSSLESFREHASIRSLTYQIILEKYWIDFDSVLETVTIENEKGDREDDI